MRKFIVQCIDKYTGAVDYTEDEVFDTYEEAYEYSEQCFSDSSAGVEVLKLAGRDYEDPDDYEYVVEEVDV